MLDREMRRSICFLRFNLVFVNFSPPHSESKTSHVVGTVSFPEQQKKTLRVRVSGKTGQVTKALHVGLAEEARSPGSCTSTRAVFVKVKASMPCHSPFLFAALWYCETAAVS